MAELIWVATLTIAMSVGLSSQQPDVTLQSAFDRLDAAWIGHDAAVWDRMVEPNALVQHGDGIVHVKLDEVEHVAEGTSVLAVRAEGEDWVKLNASGNSATRRYSSERGPVVQFWRRLPNGNWVLMNHTEWSGRPPQLQGRTKA